MELFSTLSHFVIMYPSIPLGIAVILLLIYTAYLHHKIHRFTRGKTSLSLEDVMRECVDGISKIEERNELISKHALLLDEKISHTIRNVETVRYKAFDTNGSHQSFSIAFLNEQGNGVILSTLHAHDRVSTFAKPIQNYTSLYELTEEETTVLQDAQAKHIRTSKIED
jgi:hypothetical protein